MSESTETGTESSLEITAADLLSFGIVGIVSTTQQLTHLAAGEASDDLELIAEESLALTTVTTARVLEVELASMPALASQLIPSVFKLPLTYFDYILGTEVLIAPDASKLPDTRASYERIARKLKFYLSHFVSGNYPGPKQVQDKMSLWMGRISSPGLHEHPAARMERLGTVDVLNRHLKLVREFTRQQARDRQ